jgi:hypothetical protein
VTIRDTIVENFAGDLEYHPQRALVYMLLGVICACVWIFSPYVVKFGAIPLVFALGSLSVFVKGIFLFRRSSEGLGLSDQELAELSDSSQRKNTAPFLAQTAQFVQDFGTGSFLLWPLLNFGKEFDQAWDDPPRLSIFLCGAGLFFLGWLVRRATSRRSI